MEPITVDDGAKNLCDAQHLLSRMSSSSIVLAKSSKLKQILRAKLLGCTLTNDEQIFFHVLFLDLGCEEYVKLGHIWSAPEEIRFIPQQVNYNYSECPKSELFGVPISDSAEIQTKSFGFWTLH